MKKINFFVGNLSYISHKTGGCVEIINVYVIYFSQIQLIDNISAKRSVGIIILDTFTPFIISQAPIYPQVAIFFYICIKKNN